MRDDWNPFLVLAGIFLTAMVLGWGLWISFPREFKITVVHEQAQAVKE